MISFHNTLLTNRNHYLNLLLSPDFIGRVGKRETFKTLYKNEKTNNNGTRISKFFEHLCAMPKHDGEL